MHILKTIAYELPTYIALVVIFLLAVKKRQVLGRAFVPALIWCLWMMVVESVNITWSAYINDPKNEEKVHEFLTSKPFDFNMVFHYMHLITVILAGVAILINREKK